MIVVLVYVVEGRDGVSPDEGGQVGGPVSIGYEDCHSGAGLAARGPEVASRTRHPPRPGCVLLREAELGPAGRQLQLLVRGEDGLVAELGDSLEMVRGKYFLIFIVACFDVEIISWEKATNF